MLMAFAGFTAAAATVRVDACINACEDQSTRLVLNTTGTGDLTCCRGEQNAREQEMHISLYSALLVLFCQIVQLLHGGTSTPGRPWHAQRQALARSATLNATSTLTSWN